VDVELTDKQRALWAIRIVNACLAECNNDGDVAAALSAAEILCEQLPLPEPPPSWALQLQCELDNGLQLYRSRNEIALSLVEGVKL
jgi:hypothetical protein